MIEQHLALEIDPARALAGLAVRNAAQEGPELVGQAAEHLLAVVERDAADQVQAIPSLHEAPPLVHLLELLQGAQELRPRHAGVGAGPVGVAHLAAIDVALAVYGG